MPSIAEIINPAGEGGAAVGMGAPLTGPSDKARLSRPLERGPYVVASKDRKTILKMLVLSRDEAGYDPDTYALSPLSAEADPELIARMRATWTLAQFTFESHDAAVYPALDFLLGVCSRMALLSDGLVADAVSQRYLLPDQVFHAHRADPRIDARDHVAVRFREKPEGTHAFTLGMQKFSLPEYEITSLNSGETEAAARFMLVIAQTVLQGNLTKPGTLYGAAKAPFEARSGGFDRALWEGIDVFELLPPTKLTAGEALAEWAKDS